MFVYLLQLPNLPKERLTYQIRQIYFRKGTDKMKFFCYSLFGWGMPLLMAILTGLFDHYSELGSIRPQMGESVCFLSIRGARFFFYMPILILLCFNTLMYLVTIYSLWNTKKATKRASNARIASERCSRNYTLVSLLLFTFNAVFQTVWSALAL